LVSKIRDDLISRRKRRETPLNRAAK
jgi:hypothetical protein